MRVAVIGPGATGLLFATHFARASNPVVLADHDPERAAKLSATGIVEVEGEAEATSLLPVLTEAEGEPFDLALITVKAGQTEAAALRAASFLGAGGVALTLQNGIGAGELLAKVLGPERVLVGTTSQGSTLLSPGRFRRGGEGPTRIGAYSRAAPRRDDVVALFNEAGFPAEWEERIDDALWLKLAVNCGINAITALTGVKNAGVAQIPEAAALAGDAVREVSLVAKASGIELPDADQLIGKVLGVAVATGKNRSSMGQDVDRKRRTEIEFINGAVVAAGERAGVDTPVNRTLTRLIRTLEEGWRIS